MEQEKKIEPCIARKQAIHPALSALIYVVGVVLLTLSLSGLVVPVMKNVFADAVPQLAYYIIMESCLLISIVGMAWLMLRYVDRRPFSDLGLTLRGHRKDILYGLLFVVALYAIGFGISLVSGSVQVIGVHFHPADFIVSWFFFVMVAFAEEIMIRGYLLEHLLRTKMNKFFALLLSSLVFAAGHLFNPGIAFLPMLNLVLAGLLLGAAFLYTRNLWFPVSFHLFWNWIQGPILGYEVSGNSFGKSLLTLRFPEPNLINGGTFGFEGSLLCTVLIILSTIGTIWWFERKA